MITLPNEILFLIGQYIDELPFRDSRKTLARLCQCNRHFYRIFSQFHYSKISFSPCQYGGCSPDRCHCLSIIIGLVQSLYRNPDTALHVKELELGQWNADDDISLADHLDADHRPVIDEKLLTPVLKCLSGDDVEASRWMKDLKDGLLDPWVALLLPVLRNLRMITLSARDRHPYFQTTLIRLANGTVRLNGQPALSRLEHVSVSCNAQEGGQDTSCVIPFFKFPAMRKITAYFMDEDLDDSEGWTTGLEIVPRSSSVSELEILYSNGISGMSTWTTLCKRLESFKIEVGDWGASDIDLGVEEFRGSLAAAQSSLTTLQIDYSEGSLITIDPTDELGLPFGSLKDFIVLRDLHMRFPSLLGGEERDEEQLHLRDILPASLECLHVCECRQRDVHYLVSEMANLLRQKEMSVPILRVLSVSCPSDYDSHEVAEYFTDITEGQVDGRALLNEICQAAGVEFLIGSCWSGVTFQD
ncbi:hypothetical protein FE257_000687 [Aspergillus nanangensis]|uniref:Leucine-rich repeat domain-containing protein n=1 Tax=Aspergillus nanangensis TaxID=2582783 RepID=A0AAD4GQ60_ASPNN|nr:hypothetical protein FE257_000687 [Aspergillus nanangensis]